MRPHVGLQITDPNGRVLQQIAPEPARHIDIPPTDLQAIMTACTPLRRSRPARRCRRDRGFPKPVYGKTGTAEFTGRADQSWYVAYVPDPVRPIVVAATVESGGFGAQSRGARRAADPVAVVRCEKRGHRRDEPHAVSATPISRSADEITSRSGPRMLLYPWLLLATLGLIGCSLVTIKGATRNDIPARRCSSSSASSATRSSASC